MNHKLWITNYDSKTGEIGGSYHSIVDVKLLTWKHGVSFGIEKLQLLRNFVGNFVGNFLDNCLEHYLENYLESCLEII